MPPVPPVLDLEKLRTGKQTGPLSDETQAQIAAQAELELKQEEEARAKGSQAPAPEIKVEDHGAPKKTDEEIAAEKKKEEEDLAKKAIEEKAEKERLEKEAKDADDALIAAIMAKPDEELSDEEKTRKKELVEKDPELAFQEEVKAYAKAENISPEDAKEILDAERKIVEQHKADPKKLARSYRSAQSAYSRLETKIKQDQDRAASVLKDNEVVIAGKKLTFDEARDQMVQMTRERFAGKSIKVGDKEIPIAEIDDEKVFEFAKADYQAKIKAYTSQVQGQIQTNAKKKRDEIVSKLPQYALPFKDRFVELLGFVKDESVLDDDFDPDYVLHSARGSFYTPEKVKELEAAAFKRGQENAKILGLKNSPNGGNGGGPPKPEAKSPDAEVATLNADHKKRALDMFQGSTYDAAGWDEPRKYREYVDFLKSVNEWPIKTT